MALQTTNSFSRLGMTFAVFSGAVVLDIGSKWLVLNVVMVPPRLIEITSFFNLTLGFNTGISFGMFQSVFADRALLLVFFQAIIAAGFLAGALRANTQRDRFSLGVIAGGAVGNAFDRARHGAVTDFIDFHFAGWHWPAFNLADSAITLGVTVFVVGALLPVRRSEKLATRHD